MNLLLLTKLKERRSQDAGTTIRSLRRKRKLQRVLSQWLQLLRLLQEQQLLMEAKRNRKGEIIGNKRKAKPMMVKQRGLSSQSIELKAKTVETKMPRKLKLQLKAKAKRETENQEIKKKMDKKMVMKMDQVSQSIESKEKRQKRTETKQNKRIRSKKRSLRRRRISFTETHWISRRRRSSSPNGKSIIMATGNADLVRHSSPWILLSQRHLQLFQSQLKLIIGRKSKILMIELRKSTIALMRRKVNLMRFLKRNISTGLVKTKLREKRRHQSKT